MNELSMFMLQCTEQQNNYVHVFDDKAENRKAQLVED